MMANALKSTAVTASTITSTIPKNNDTTPLSPKASSRETIVKKVAANKAARRRGARRQAAVDTIKNATMMAQQRYRSCSERTRGILGNGSVRCEAAFRSGRMLCIDGINRMNAVSKNVSMKNVTKSLNGRTVAMMILMIFSAMCIKYQTMLIDHSSLLLSGVVWSHPIAQLSIGLVGYATVWYIISRWRMIAILVSVIFSIIIIAAIVLFTSLPSLSSSDNLLSSYSSSSNMNWTTLMANTMDDSAKSSQVNDTTTLLPDGFPLPLLMKNFPTQTVGNVRVPMVVALVALLVHIVVSRVSKRSNRPSLPPSYRPLRREDPQVEAIVLSFQSKDCYRSHRTVRALSQLGINAHDMSIDCMSSSIITDLAAQLVTPNATRYGMWLIRSGTWPTNASPLSLFPPADGPNGISSVAIGAIQRPVDSVMDKYDANVIHDADTWTKLVMNLQSSSNQSMSDALLHRQAPFGSIFIDGHMCTSLAQALLTPTSLECDWSSSLLLTAIHAAARVTHARVVMRPYLNVYDDHRLRVAQILPAIQRGGAERVVLELAAKLPDHGVKAIVITTATAARSSYSQAQNLHLIDVSYAGCHDGRLQAAGEAALSMAADVIHAHLCNAADLETLKQTSHIPLMTTVHNSSNGWPRGLSSSPHIDLLVACSSSVATQLHEAKAIAPVRTVWNGIDFAALHRSPASRDTARQQIRQLYGIPHNDIVLVTVANIRSQKRLHLLPPVLAAVRAQLSLSSLSESKRRQRDSSSPRGAWLIIAGEMMPHRDSTIASSLLDRAILSSGVSQNVLRPGSIDNISSLLAASDIMINTSLYEGLSMAQLEALAADVPVVTTDVAGSNEIAHGNNSVHVIPLQFTTDQACNAIMSIIRSPPVSGSGRDIARVHFSSIAMASRYASLLPSVITAAHASQRASYGDRGQGLWIVINNLGMGGAQSSARRLLHTLHQHGEKVYAAVIQEELDNPSDGVIALREAGIPVVMIPPLLNWRDAQQHTTTLVNHINESRARAILFWNLMPVYKTLLSDRLLGDHIKCIDVSPGEMNFSSLRDFFAAHRPSWPYRTSQEYGATLYGAVTKFGGERTLAAEVFGLPLDRVHVVANGVPPMLQTTRVLNSQPNHEQPIVLGTSCRISPQKKLEQLIEAVRLIVDDPRMPPFVLHIAGGIERKADEYDADMRRLAKGLPIEWVGEFTNIVFPHDFSLLTLCLY
jgi:glycosyltransferase involved in cell wall biosynthesis